MTKTLRVRPIWVCLKLCGGDTKAAIFMEEALFRAVVTKFNNEGNPVIIFSLEEWSDNIGLSLNQVRDAIDRAAALNLIRKYNARHPFKPVLRGLHIEVPAALAELFSHLTNGDYRFEGGTLHLSHISFGTEINITDYAPESTSACPITVSPQDSAVCPQSTLPHLYNKEDNEEGLSSDTGACHKEKKEEPVEGDKQEIESGDYETSDDDGQTDSFAAIPTLFDLLTALYEFYAAYHAEKVALLNKPDFNAYDAGKVWKEAMEASYSKYSQKPLGGKEYKLLKTMTGEFPPDILAKLIKNVVSKWVDFLKYVAKEETITYAPHLPDVGFLFMFRHHAYNKFLFKLDIKEQSENLTYEKQIEELGGNKKLNSL